MSSPTRALGCVALCLATLTACTTQPVEPAPPPAPTEPPAPAGLPGGALSTRAPVELAFQLSGADLVTIWANGGANTRLGTQLGDRDLSFTLVSGDDVEAQVQRYQNGQTPYLRAAWATVGNYYGQLCPTEDAPSCPHLVLGLAASQDDVLVARQEVKSIADLKGKVVSLQRGGPHAEALFTLLQGAGLAWSDVRVMWKSGLVGAGSPAEAFPVDTNLQAVWALSQDVPGLLHPSVPAPEGMTPAYVLTSSADHPDLVVDCLFVRKDYLDAHPQEVEHLRAGWLHAAEQVKALRPGSPESDAFLAAVAGVYGPGLVADAAAAKVLLEGATLYGLPENVRLTGDSPDQVDHVDLSERSRTFAEVSGRPTWAWTIGVAPTHWGGADFADLPQQTPAASPRLVIPIAADATAFDPAPHAAELDRVLSALSAEGSVLRVRGHVDPQRALEAALKAGVDSGKVVRGGTDAQPTYTIDGKLLEVTDGKELISALPVPAELAREARLVATTRAQAVRDGVLAYAAAHGVVLDAARVQVEGVGVDEPLVGLNAAPEQSAKARRVELIVVSAGQNGASSGGW